MIGDELYRIDTGHLPVSGIKIERWKWCEENCRGGWIYHVESMVLDGPPSVYSYARYIPILVFYFQDERDAALFKTFWC